MDNFGNFGVKKYVREVVVKDEDGKDVCITLKYTAQTPLIYMNYFSRDMFDDIAKMSIQGTLKSDVLEKANRDIESVTAEEWEQLTMPDACEFFDNFAVALIATSLYPKTVSYDTIREKMLPADFITDDRYTELYQAEQDLFLPVVEDYKKKLMQIVAIKKKSRT